MSPVFAEQEAAEPQTETVFSAGIGFLTVDQAQKGADTDMYVLPLLIDTEHHLLVFGTNIDYVLLYEDGWMFSLTGSPRLKDITTVKADI